MGVAGAASKQKPSSSLRVESCTVVQGPCGPAAPFGPHAGEVASEAEWLKPKLSSLARPVWNTRRPGDTATFESLPTLQLLRLWSLNLKRSGFGHTMQPWLRVRSDLGCGYVQDAPVCWICLDGARADTSLMRPCNCPRHAHAGCLARWQLQSAGSRYIAHARRKAAKDTFCPTA